nr:immunoglobulin heavy chain junction region [Macaca mulatta]MOW19048.1 immunoglobulin heavy chain junction region [Macaca mulatta]MOW19235.1 immunoglobulin heavy chain junction region [Macaca mulatta]MOW19306.1 immunoglobulin heavy chain junction region [Macaca mulatta]MOW19316.1 immunoglobulin heavy chain junction region [Macaca mulatta]
CARATGVIIYYFDYW